MASAPGEPPAPALLCERLSFQYPRGEEALSGITLRVERGQRLGILGPNGGGKSTLVKIIAGLLPGASGRVEVLGVSPAAARARGLIGYVPQRSLAELATPLSAREVVELAASVRLAPWRGLDADTKARVERALGITGAEAIADLPIGDLSGGQLQRVLIARALAADPQILLLDEPTVGLDVAGQRAFADLLERLAGELKLTVILVSHDLRTIASGCDRVACLSRTLHAHTDPKGLTPELLAEVFAHDVLPAGQSLLGSAHTHAGTPCVSKGCSHEHPPPPPPPGREGRS